MSEVVQLYLGGSGQAAAAAQSKARGVDAGTDGFAQLFEQQMQAQPASAPSPVPASPPAAPAPSPGNPAPAKTREDDERPETDAASQPVAQAVVPTPATPVPAVQAPVAPPAEAAGSEGQPAVAPAPALVAVGIPTPGSAPGAGKLPLQAGAPGMPAPSAGQDVQAPASAVQAAVSEAKTIMDAASPALDQGSAAPRLQPVPAVAPALGKAQDAAQLMQAGGSADAPSAGPSTPAGADSASLLNPAVAAILTAGSAVSAPVQALAAPEGLEGAVPVTAGGVPDPAAPAAAESGEAPATPRGSQAEMIERLAATAKLMTTERGEKVFLLRLQPPQLGPIRVQLTVQDGVMNATVHAESHAARQAILQNLDHLKAALADQDLQLGRFQVSVDGETGAQLSARQGGGRGRRSPEEELADTLMSVPLADPGRRRDDDEEFSPAASDAMAVDLLA